MNCKSVLPAEAGSIKQKMHVVKNWTKKRQDGGCNACLGGIVPFVCGRTPFYPSESNVTAHNAIGRGAGEERAGSTLLDTKLPGMLIIFDRTKNQNGRRDQGSREYLTRPGYKAWRIYFLLWRSGWSRKIPREWRRKRRIWMRKIVRKLCDCRWNRPYHWVVAWDSQGKQVFSVNHFSSTLP